MKLQGKKLTGELNLAEFVDVKGWKALGNKFSDQLLMSVKEIEVSEIQALKEAKLQIGESVDLDITTGGGNGQVTLF
jgi:hypothetical protein